MRSRPLTSRSRSRKTSTSTTRPAGAASCGSRPWACPPWCRRPRQRRKGSGPSGQRARRWLASGCSKQKVARTRRRGANSMTAVPRPRDIVQRGVMKPSLGYKLSSEEQSPAELVRQAQMAEDTGFEFALISDHYHPWTDRQGQSPFVWSVIGAIAQATRRLVVGTAVTCPTVRIHPAIVAQAAATTAALMPGRFFLGVGTGENLNEHILGARGPETEVRQERLTEAIEVIRLLWQGGNRSYHGRHFTVENARLYTLPDSPPPLYIAVGGKHGAEQAARLGDGMIGTDPERSLLAAFDKAGGAGKPRYAELTVCWATDEATGRRIAHEQWPTSAMESS